MSVKIKNTQPRILSLCTGERFTPGAVEDISDENFSVVKEDPTFLSWCKLGWMKVMGGKPAAQPPVAPVLSSAASEPPAFSEPAAAPPVEGVPPVEGAPGSPLVGKTAVEAMDIVAAETDVDVLLLWNALETRKGVRTAIEKRLLQLESSE